MGVETINSLQFDTEAAVKDEIKPEVESNPTVFLEKFRQSDTYKEAYEAFYEGKTLSPDVTLQEKIEVFEEDEQARYALINYSQTHHKDLRYSPSYYPDRETKEAIDNYLKWVKILNDISHGKYEDATGTKVTVTQKGDAERTHRHLEAARSIVSSNITRSPKLARGLVDLMLVNEKLNTHDNAMRSIISRIEYVANETPQVY